MNQTTKKSIIFLTMLSFVAILVISAYPNQVYAQKYSLQYYLNKRENCIRTEFNEHGHDYNTEYQKAYYNSKEWQCTRKIIAKIKKKRSTKAIGLCLRTHYLTGYTNERGIAGDFDKETLDAMHFLGMYEGITIDSDGNVDISKEQMKKWKTYCKTYLENLS